MSGTVTQIPDSRTDGRNEPSSLDLLNHLSFSDLSFVVVHSPPKPSQVSRRKVGDEPNSRVDLDVSDGVKRSEV